MTPVRPASDRNEIEASLELVWLQGHLADEDLGPVRPCRDACARMVFGLMGRLERDAGRGAGD
jgi:hypothetical protein